MKKIAFLTALLMLLCAGALAEDKTSDLKFTVVKEDNGKPVRNASIVLHQVDKEGRQGKGGFQLKTDPDGQASFPGAPYGKLRVQVLVRGFQTFGEDYEINQPAQEIVIKLKRPQSQYSIYENKPKQEEKPKQ